MLYTKERIFYKKTLRSAASVLLAAGVTALSGCFNFQPDNSFSAIGTYDFSKMHLVQLEEPYEGQPLAVIETTRGTVKAVLYPEYAPNTVTNFINRVNEGYYDGKDVDGIYEKAYFMTEERTQGVTDTGEPIANECSVDLWTFKGALCSYNGKAGYGDSRFFVINEKELPEDEVEQLRGFKNKDEEQLLPDELIDAFVSEGCIVDFAGCYTVFGQTIEGFDVIEAICGSEIGGDWLQPVEPVYINKITVTQYSPDPA